ncbi:MAG: ABC transporter ATPase [Lachnospiraceae bacterium]|nr:ABC transporter ATPase [Lachnospiraceae bacterium]
MKKLSTIQKREKLNEVFAVDAEGPGGANHLYMICKNESATLNDAGDSINVDPEDVMCTLQLQCGPRKDENAIHGVIDTDLLEIVRDRLIAFQAGPFSSRENACALTHIEEALMWMNRRVEDRIERNVLGTNQK